MNNVDVYLMKALDAYPCNLEETIESINYSLSANDRNPFTYILLGRFYMEQFYDYKEAILCFEKVLELDLDNCMVYAELAKAYINNEDFEKARKVIDHGMKVKGTSKELLLTRSIILYEKQMYYKLAKKELKKLKMMICHDDYKNWIEKATERLKEKEKYDLSFMVEKKRSEK